MFLSNSDHQVLTQDLEIRTVDTETLSNMSRRQQELKICFSMDNAKPDPAKTDLCK